MFKFLRAEQGEINEQKEEFFQNIEQFLEFFNEKVICEKPQVNDVIQARLLYLKLPKSIEEALIDVNSEQKEKVINKTQVKLFTILSDKKLSISQGINEQTYAFLLKDIQNKFKTVSSPRILYMGKMELSDWMETYEGETHKDHLSLIIDFLAIPLDAQDDKREELESHMKEFLMKFDKTLYQEEDEEEGDYIATLHDLIQQEDFDDSFLSREDRLTGQCDIALSELFGDKTKNLRGKNNFEKVETYIEAERLASLYELIETIFEQEKCKDKVIILNKLLLLQKIDKEIEHLDTESRFNRQENLNKIYVQITGTDNINNIQEDIDTLKDELHNIQKTYFTSSIENLFIYEINSISDASIIEENGLDDHIIQHLKRQIGRNKPELNTTSEKIVNEQDRKVNYATDIDTEQSPIEKFESIQSIFGEAIQAPTNQDTIDELKDNKSDIEQQKKGVRKLYEYLGEKTKSVPKQINDVYTRNTASIEGQNTDAYTTINQINELLNTTEIQYSHPLDIETHQEYTTERYNFKKKRYKVALDHRFRKAEDEKAVTKEDIETLEELSISLKDKKVKYILLSQDQIEMIVNIGNELKYHMDDFMASTHNTLQTLTSYEKIDSDIAQKVSNNRPWRAPVENVIVKDNDLAKIQQQKNESMQLLDAYTEIEEKAKNSGKVAIYGEEDLDFILTELPKIREKIRREALEKNSSN